MIDWTAGLRAQEDHPSLGGRPARERQAQMDRHPSCTIIFAHSAVFRIIGPDWLVGGYSLRAWSFILHPLGDSTRRKT